MYIGQEISPRNRHTRTEYLPRILPPAPIETTNGKTRMTQNDSYIPFIHKWCGPPIRGTERTTAINRLQTQKAPRTRTSQPRRHSSTPPKKGKSTRVNPMFSCCAFSDHPPMRSPDGPHTV